MLGKFRVGVGRTPGPEETQGERCSSALPPPLPFPHPPFSLFPFLPPFYPSFWTWRALTGIFTILR